MRPLDCETWDDGRLTVNADFAETLRANGLETFASIMHSDRGDVAKNLRQDRTTFRIPLTTLDGETRDFYLKRHWPAPLREYVKPLLRLRWPIVGAKNEWVAIQHFLQAGIPTTIPAAFGQDGRESFLLTEGLRDCVKLSDWFSEVRSCPSSQRKGGKNSDVPVSIVVRLNSCEFSYDLADVIDRVAQTAKRMHAAGLHHQDFYLGHLMLPADRERGIQVIDLGRARKRRRLASRWIVKDLAQLKYSARDLPEWAVERLFARYFANAPRRRIGDLVLRIDDKVDRIARHTRKRKL